MTKKLSKNGAFAGPQFDESLHSFILRALLRTGNNDLSGVVSKSGGWVLRPEAPRRIKEELSNLDKVKLLKLYELHYTIFNSVSLFDNPFQHLYEGGGIGQRHMSYYGVFHSNRSQTMKTSSFPIKYCRHCIQYQIWKYGFAYFKSEWNIKNRCSIHMTGLSLVEPNLKESPYEYMGKILQGRSLIPSSVASGRCLTPDLRALDDARFAPCLKNEVLAFSLSKFDSFPSGYTDTVDFGLLSFKEKLALSKLSFKEELYSSPEPFYEAQIEQNYSEILPFLVERALVIDITYIDEYVASDKRSLLKSKVSDCSKCNHAYGSKGIHTCLASNLIYIKNLNEAVNYPILNVTDEKLMGLKPKIHHHQNLLGAGRGERRVRHEIMQHEMYTQHGGKAGYKQYLERRKIDRLKSKS